MKLGVTKFILVVFFSFPLLLIANSKTDSLQNELEKTRDILQKAELYYELSEEYGFSNIDSSFIYAQKLVQYIKDIEQDVSGKDLRKLQLVSGKGNNNLGVLFYVMGNLNKGIEYLEKSIVIREALDDTLGLIESYGNVFQLYQAKYDYKNSFKIISKLTSLAERIDDKSAIAKSYFSYGSLYIELKDYTNAINKFEKAIEISDKINDKVMKSRALSQLGIIYRNQGKDSLALNSFLSSYENIKGSNNPSISATVLSNIGSIYNDNGDYQKALGYARESMNIRVKSNLVNDIYNSYNNIARLFYKMGLKDSVLYYSNKAYELSGKLKNNTGLREASYMLYMYYSGIGNYVEALKYHEEYTKYALLINDVESKKSLDKMLLQEEYESAQKTDSIAAAKELEMNKAILGAKISSQKKVIYFVIGIVLILIVLSVFIYKNYRQKVKYSEKIELQSMLLETKNQEITDSIQYAKRLQDAILPSTKSFKKHFQDSFVVYQPKDIVAGDFYFLEVMGNNVIFAAADCTGHGVPGAMVSVVCSNALNRAVNEYQLTKPSEILEKVRQLVTKTFQKSESEVRDGMDISICNLNIQTKELLWAGANNPLWIVRNKTDEIEEFKADKQPIGYTENPKPFTNHKIQLEKDDLLYLFSDGLADQFGGDKGKKFKSSSIKKLLLSLNDKSMEEQRVLILDAFKEWKGNLEQVDDICLIGVKV